MILKHGVDPGGIRPELIIALNVANDVYRYREYMMRVTSIRDSTHGWSSLHYSGAAADLGTKEHGEPVERGSWTMQERTTWGEELARQIHQALGSSNDYDVLFEHAGQAEEHIHIEWQPKRRG